jgi:RNA polymerase sigma-70 factor (ECF subfamily)
VDHDLAAIGGRLARGDPRAVADCYRALGPSVMGYLRRYVPQPDVEDVLQRVFYEVWRSHARYDARYSLRAWVFGIARKRAIDHLRGSRGIPAPNGQPRIVALQDVDDIAGHDGRDDAERFVRADQVRGALAELPDTQREVIVMAFFEGYTQAEIAQFLRIPLGTVKTRTFRGLQRLAELLQYRQADHE